MKPIKQVAIVGMGALGMLYGDLILSAGKDISLTYLADSARIEKYKQTDFSVNGRPVHFPVTDPKDATPADLVIVAVKAPALSSALDTMAPAVGKDTLLLSVMNGITSEEILRDRFGPEHILYCVAQGMDATRLGSSLTYSTSGALHIGILDDPTLSAGPEALARLTAFLDEVHMAYVVEADIRFRLWGKLMLNVGVNQTCMVYELTYGELLESKEAMDTCLGAMREVMEVANAEGIPLSEKDIDGYVELLQTMGYDCMPSMRQDGLAHRKSEVEIFAGTIRTLAGKHHLSVPVNDWLYEKIQEKERTYG